MLIARFNVVLALLFSLCAVSSAAAEESPISVIPAQSAVVVRFTSPDATIDKVADFLDQLQAGGQRRDPAVVEGAKNFAWGDHVRSLKDTLGDLFGDAVDLKREWWLFCREMPDADLSIGMVLPATDTELLQASFAKVSTRGSDHQSIVHHSWVICGAPEEVDAARLCLSGTGKSIETRLNAEGLAVFNSADVGVLVDLKRLMTNSDGTAENPDEIPEVAEIVEGVSSALKEFFAGWLSFEISDSDHSSKILDQIVAAVAKAFVQGINDTEFLAISLAMDEDEIRFEHYLAVKADSATAAVLRASPGSEIPSLSSLPASSAVYLGFGGNQKSLAAWVTETKKAIVTSIEPDLAASFDKALNDTEKLNFGSYVMAIPMRPVDQGILRWLSITEVDDPQRARELGVQWKSILDKLTAGEDEGNPVPVESTDMYGEYSADVLSYPKGTAFPYEDDEIGQAAEKLLFGPDGIATRTVYLNDRIVESFGGSKIRTAAAIRRIADVSKGSAVDDPAFMKAREKLDKSANLLLMVDASVVAAASMHAWNQYMDIILASVVDQAEGPNAVVMDEPSGKQPADKSPPKKLTVDDSNDDIAVQAVAMVVDDDVEQIQRQIQQMKFEKDAIDSMNEPASLIGLSLAFEPQAARLKIVIPKMAVKQLVNLGTAIVARSGMFGIDLGIEVDDDDE